MKKRETIVEDMVGLVMTNAQSVHEPTLTRIGGISPGMEGEV